MQNDQFVRGGLPSSGGRFCAQCGAVASAEARFCASCGVVLLMAPPVVDAVRGGEAMALVRLQEAQALLDAGDAAGAVPMLRALCAELPQWPAAWVNLAVACLRTGQIHESQDALETAEALAPGSFACEVAFAEFHARLGFFDRAVTRLDRALALTPPSNRAQATAIELRRFCAEHAKGLYYRQAAFPHLSFRWLRRGSDRTATELTTTTQRSN